MEPRVIQTLSKQRDSGTIVELVENEAGFRFVVKRILNLEEPIYRAIFQKETQALTRLKACENIVRIFRSDIQISPNGRSEGIISMEYVPGRPLARVLDTIPNASTRYFLVKQLTNAIRHAHQNSVIHRDINPSNILITDTFELKLIDFGIAKIRGMFQDGTTYQFATQNYSAPEVTIHSENATERSDIYSLGAVIYFLFTGEVPVTTSEMPLAIQSAGGIDVKLKEVLLKMCAPSPADRYENIDDCELALAPLYQRYCGSDERYYFAVPTNALDELKNRNLVRKNTHYQELLNDFLPSQFTGGLIRRRVDGDTPIYCFDGISISMECVLSDDFFQVIRFRRLDAFKREQHKRFSMEVPGRFQFLFSHRIINTPLLQNCSQILSNRIEDFQADIHSQKNIDREYDTQYGIWRQFIQAMIEDASKNAARLYYTSVHYEDGLFLFQLDLDSVPDDAFNQDTLFICEQRGRSNKKPLLVEVGNFLEYREDGAVLAVKALPRKPRLPDSSSICLDYRREIQQYRRQEAALEEFRRSETANGGNLKGIFVGAEQPGYFQFKSTIHYYNEQLDFTQKRAVRKALEAEDIALIQGPPGTGKTNVLVEVIRQILGQNQRNPALSQKILIVSQSHAAVDKLLEDLSDYLEDTTIRIGREENIDSKINERFGLDHCQALWVQESVENCKAWLAQRLSEQDVPMEAFCKYARVVENLKLANLEQLERAQLEQIAAKFENTYGKNRSNPWLQSCLLSEQWIRRISESDELEEYYIKNASIIVGTCIGVISDPHVRDTTFDYVIVDEAAKATLPEIMVPLVRARKAILVGDHKQLPPVFDRNALKASFQSPQIAELQNTGFGKLFDILPDNCKETLSTQYRMHPAIGDLISLLFYDGKVQNGVNESERTTGIPMLNGRAITWLTTSNSGAERFEQPIGSQHGYVNHLEVTVIQRCLQKLNQEIAGLGETYSIGIITPYRAQLDLIRNRLKQSPLSHIEVDINTVDAFQGSQRDIIIYSTVRSSNRWRIGFLREEPRLNVAFSRAKRALIIVGDQKFLSNPRIPGNRFPHVISYMREHPEFCQEIDEKEFINAD